MGKKIDGFVLSLAAACALYFYFLGAFESRTAAILLALFCWWMGGKILKRAKAAVLGSAWIRRMQICKSAGGTLAHLACLPEEQAHEAVATLLQHSYSGEYELEIIQLHPSMNLPQDRLFEIWRRHRGESRLAVCTTCRCDADCHILASTLKEPKVAVIDASVLSRLIAEHPDGLYRPEEKHARRKLRLKHMLSLVFSRKNAPRCLLFSASMLIMYLLGGSMWYLASSMMLFFISMVSLRHARRPAKLF